MTASVANTAESKPKSRRALLAGALGGLGAWAASAVGRASPALAEGENIQIGQEYTSAQSVTRIGNQANDSDVLRVDSFGQGTAITGYSAAETGVLGFSDSGTGVHGSSDAGVGVSGFSLNDSGVRGVSFSKAATVGHSRANLSGAMGFSGDLESQLPPAKAKTGVYGEATQDANSRGVWGRSNGGYGVEGQATGGTGVYGTSQSGLGVHGTSFYDVGVAGNSSAADMPAVRGRAAGNSTGVLGFSGVAAQPPAAALTGVYGYAIGRGSAGVRGETTSGLGVRALATTGTAVLAESTSGYALYTAGRLKAEKVSGVATVAAGSTSKTISPGVDVTSGSFVLLTPKANIGSRALWFSTNDTDNTFTIRMSSSRSSNTKVAWLLLG